MANRHSAAGQMAGYTYQLERTLYWLSVGDTNAVGIETEDDVVKRSIGPDSIDVLEQDKSTIAGTNPLSDSSKNLWVTLAIWAEAISKGDVDPRRTKFFLVTNAPLNPASLAAQISAAQSPEECMVAYSRALTVQSEMTGIEILKIAAELTAHPQDLLLDLISRVEMEGRNEASHGPTLAARIADNLHLAASVPTEKIIDEMLGWIVQSAQEMWRSGRPVWLTKRAFDDRFTEALKRHLKDSLRITAEHLLKLSDADRQAHAKSLFVRQIQHVTQDSDSHLVVEAVDDYLRSAAEFTRLSGLGIVARDDVVGFTNRIQRRWRTIFHRETRHLKQSSLTPDELRALGYEIYDSALDHRETLCGQATEAHYLTRGRYQRLSDELEVGWHPHFETLCRPGEGED